MKVLLIAPVPPRRHWPRGIFRNNYVPTGLAQIASVLKAAGHQVRLYAREEHFFKLKQDWQAAEQHFRNTLTEFRPDVLGLSVCTPMLDDARCLAAIARELLGSELLVVAGGPHATALPQQTLEYCLDLDVVAIGEGERTMLELLQHGLGPNVHGICYREGESFRTTPPRPPLQDLDTLAPIDYSLLDMAHYTAPSRWLIRWLEMSATNVRTSRGCTHACLFCGGHLVAGVGVRFHSVHYVMDRLKHVVNRFNVRGIHFEDDTLGADPERLLTLCDALRSAGLHERIVWDGCLRADQADAKLLAEMKRAGCIQIEYGFESGSDAMLRRLGKASSVEVNRRAVRLTHEAGLRVFADIMFALPGETAADITATTRFLRWAQPEVVSVSQLCPLPGTALFHRIAPAIRSQLDWGALAYLETHKLGINVTAMSDAKLARANRQFLKAFIAPWVQRQMLRDTAPGSPGHAALSTAVRRYRRRHPIRYARMPV